MPVDNGPGGTSITGDAIGGFRLKVIASAIGLYLKTGMQANRSYTPANMRYAVTQMTGKTYARSRKGLETALKDLEALMEGKTLDEIGAVEREKIG